MPKVVKLGPKKWEAVLYLGRDGAGVYRRARRRFDAPTEGAAIAEAHRLEERLGRVAADGRKVTFGDALNAWWPLWRQLEKPSPSTVDGYRKRINHDVRPGPLTDRLISTITRADVHRWYAQLGTRTSPSSVRKVQTVVHQTLQYAVDAEWIEVNPSDKPRLPKRKKPRRYQPALVDLVAVFLAAASVDAMRARALMFTARTGLRRGEVVALRWGDHVDLEGGRLLAARNVVIGPPEGGRKGKARLVEKETKAGNEAWLVLDDETLDLLEVQLAWQQRAAADANQRWSSSSKVWSIDSPFDGWLHPDTLGWWHTQARARAIKAVRLQAKKVAEGLDGDEGGAVLAAAETRCAGMARVKLHDLRHWQGGVMAAIAESVKGASLADVQKRLRHQQLGTTLDYVHAEKDDAIERQMVAEMPSFRALMAGPEMASEEPPAE